MKLKDFVKHTILDIATGIQEANDEAISMKIDLKANPKPIYFRGPGNVEYMPDSGSRDDTKQVEMIKFDVAVTSTGTVSGEAGAGINVAGFKVGGSGEVKNENENISRIKFEVPVLLPSS
jgi:hypothetical protein